MNEKKEININFEHLISKSHVVKELAEKTNRKKQKVDEVSMVDFEKSLHTPYNIENNKEIFFKDEVKFIKDEFDKGKYDDLLNLLEDTVSLRKDLVCMQDLKLNFFEKMHYSLKNKYLFFKIRRKMSHSQKYLLEKRFVNVLVYYKFLNDSKEYSSKDKKTWNNIKRFWLNSYVDFEEMLLIFSEKEDVIFLDFLKHKNN